jgi:hypothetical protein
VLIELSTAGTKFSHHVKTRAAADFRIGPIGIALTAHCERLHHENLLVEFKAIDLHTVHILFLFIFFWL